MFATAKRVPVLCAALLAGASAIAIAYVAANGKGSSQGAPQRIPGNDAAQNVNVLLISLDTTRKDHLSCYGYPRKTSPQIDALASESLVFERCVAASNWTLPSHASMLSGLYPTSHGAHWATVEMREADPGRRTGRMATSCQTLAEVLLHAGYQTGAVVANPWYLQKVFRFDQGFQHYDDRGGKPPAAYRRAEEIADLAIAWLDQIADRPFFLFLNFVDPHAPYNPPPPYDTRFRETQPGNNERPSWDMQPWLDAHDRVLTRDIPLSPAEAALFRDRYDGEIAYMDAQLGRVLSWLRERGLYDRTLVVATADHGEAFGEHEVIGHGLTLYEPEVAMPMIVKLPFGKRTGVVEHAVHHVDVMPTVLEVLGLDVPDQVQGTSMLEPSTRALVVEEYANQEKGPRWPRYYRTQRAVYRGSLKYIEYSDGARELYDLERDPLERDDLVEARPADAELMQAALQDWKERTKPIENVQRETIQFDPEHLQRLRELGYVH